MFFSPRVPEWTVADLKARLQGAGPKPLLLDIRSEMERSFSDIGGTHIPMHELPNRLQELEQGDHDEIVIYCRSGHRSASAVAWLRSRGFEHVFNLKGGINAWSREIDDSVSSY